MLDTTAFARDGFAIVPDFVDGAACDALRARAAELIDELAAAAPRSVFQTRDQARTTDDWFLDSGDQVRVFFEEDQRTVNKLGHALHELDPTFAAFSRQPRVAAVVGALGVADPRLVQSMYIVKAPHVGGEVRCHQDATFLHTEPDRVIGLWFALEDARVDNACLWAIPGGHRGGVRARFVRDGRATRMDVLDPAPFDDAQLVPLEVARGTLIVLDGHLPHLSRENRSARSRHAYTLHVISGAARYPDSNWLRRATPPPGFT